MRAYVKTTSFVCFFCAVVLLGGSSVVASSTRERPERKGAHVLLRDRSVYGVFAYLATSVFRCIP